MQIKRTIIIAMSKIFLVMAILSSMVLAGVNVIPQPDNITQVSGGVFEFTPKTAIIADANLQTLAKQLDNFISPAFGFHLSQEKQTVNIVKLQLNDNLKSLGKEGYHLVIEPNVVLIEAYQPAGIFYGIQTLRQLLPVEIFKHNKAENIKWQISSVKITDTPRFEWRGSHLDVSRHFMPVDNVKKYIDLMAMHKLNRFHWHLTDTQGWRIEIKKYPNLIEVGSKRDNTYVRLLKKDPNTVYDSTRFGGYYTQEQIREIVQYANERFIEIVPEIEMPGHSRAARLSYSWLTCDGKGGEYCPGKEEVFTFLEDVLSEVMNLFPSEYIHIGGDEVGKQGWQECANCKARMIVEGIKDVNGLQPYFTARIENFINQKGRRMVGWDEILEGKLSPQSVVMCWRDGKYAAEAADHGHDVIMVPTSHCYFDYPYSITPLDKVYNYNPSPANLTLQQSRHILGVQSCLWTEDVPTLQEAEYMQYPRGCALAEVAWTKPEKKTYDNFLTRLNEHLKRLDSYGVNYRQLNQQ